ncbi:CRAL-TRIO domain-containing protein [Cunninghamella echinulata]|nr:CRAL-TRIO domain-containing protein [Cunninghamella echinulata]
MTAATALPGRVDSLTAKEVEGLKKTWTRLLTVFQQKGTEWVAPAKKEEPKEEKKKSSRWGFGGGKKEATEVKDLFLGTTTNPEWLSLPLEKAIPLIPGRLLETTFWNMAYGDNPDAVILRFLRARKWDLDAGYNMLINCLRWRLVMRVDDITALGETGIHGELEKLKPGMGESFLDNLHSNKAVLGGPDKDGRGIAYINVRFHKKEDQDFEVIKLMTLYVMETSRMVVHQPVESCCIVFNLEGFTLANMDFDFVKFLLGCFEAYYPETLGSCLIHKAPWVFSTVWTMITPLLDPVVASKIHFTKNINELSTYVDMSVLPPFLTGKEEIKKGSSRPFTPPAGSLDNKKGPEFQAYETVLSEYTRETQAWVKSDITAADPKRKEQALKYRHASINVEQYLRARTTYHELGLAEVENGHLLLKFSGNVPTIDITDSV